MHRPSRALVLGFTLIELLIVMSVATIVILLAAPSFREMILMQRLRSTSAQLVTDVQLARSEAVSRQERVSMSFTGFNGTLSCYTIHTCEPADTYFGCQCRCALPAGSRCTGNRKEIRTVLLPAQEGVNLTLVRPPSLPVAPNRLIFDPTTGGMQSIYVGVGGPAAAVFGELWAETGLISSPSGLQTRIGQAGRPSVCTPTARRVSGVPVCP